MLYVFDADVKDRLSVKVPNPDPKEEPAEFMYYGGDIFDLPEGADYGGDERVKPVEG